MILAKFNLATEYLKQQFKLIFLQDRLLLFLLGAASIFNLAAYLLVSWLKQPVNQPLVLHYSVYFGIDLLGDWLRLFLLPLVGSFILLVNVGLTSLFYRQERLLAFFLVSVATLVEGLLLVGVGLLVWVNG